MSNGMERILIAGCGYVGSRVAELLSSKGIEVWSLNRKLKNLPSQIKQLTGDVTDFSSLPRMNMKFDTVVYAVSPQERTKEAYRSTYYHGLEHVMRKLNQSRDPGGPIRLILVSSTGIFSQNQGEWVSEETDPEPVSETSRQLLEAECLANNLGDPGIVIRLAGIYGPGRTRMIRNLINGRVDCPENQHYTNRIHRDDCAGSICHLINLSNPKSLYIGADNNPTPLDVIYSWIANKTGRKDPCESTTSDLVADRKPIKTNKRCSNQRLVESGYTFQYPSYREGYTPLIQKELANLRHA